jgi:ArsR family transcriptional regulator, virulence genes transcriptional regulator
MTQTQTQATNPNFDYAELRKAALVIRAVNHKLRQKMIGLIEDNARITVTEIFHHMNLEQSVASQHLAILRRAGVVETQREGKFIFYSLNRARLEQIATLAGQLVATA